MNVLAELHKIFFRPAPLNEHDRCLSTWDAVRAINENGGAMTTDKIGELICAGEVPGAAIDLFGVCHMTPSDVRIIAEMTGARPGAPIIIKERVFA